MTQRTALRQIDAAIHGALLGSGLADAGIYRAPGTSGDGTAVRVYVDRSLQTLGEYGQVVDQRDQVTLLRADVAPERGGTVDVDGWRYTLAERTSEDDSVSVWAVRGEALP